MKQKITRNKEECLQAHEVRKPESVRDRIKPRGLWGLFEGRIHYDKNADVFNLSV